jgi:hypothetical protein
VKQWFPVERMVEDLHTLYQRLAAAHRTRPTEPAP